MPSGGWNPLAPLEAWTEERVAEVLERDAQRLIDRWARSAAGRKLLTALLADVAADAVIPPVAGGGSSLLEDVVVGVVARMGRDPALRARLLQALGDPSRVT